MIEQPLTLSEALREADRQGIPYHHGGMYVQGHTFCALGSANKVTTGDGWNTTALDHIYNRYDSFGGKFNSVFNLVYDLNADGMSRAEIADILEGYGL